VRHASFASPATTPFRRAFTLVEMLVVIGILALLAAILLPALNLARSRARQTKCKAQLHDIMKAVYIYRGNYDEYYPPWLSTLYPNYIETPAIFLCPDDPTSGKEGGVPEWFSDPEHGAPQYPETDDNGHCEDLGPDSKPYAAKAITDMRNKKITAMSYIYEFTWAGCTWWNGGSYRSTDPNWDAGKWADFDHDGVVSWREAKETEMKGLYYSSGEMKTNEDEVYSGHVPMVRCFCHARRDDNLFDELVLNVACENGYVYECQVEGSSWKKAKP